MSDRAQKVAEETGALVYWQDAAASADIIAKDKKTLRAVGAASE